MKKIIIIVVIFVILIIGAGFTFVSLRNKESSPSPASKIFSDIKTTFSKYPKCPTNLASILTAPLMEPDKISALTPLGNINPPGHTSPVDHIYFATNEIEKIPLYAPADSWITNITEISYKDASGQYIPTEYVLTYTVCDGLILTLASYTELVPAVRDELAKKSTEGCKSDIDKPGHDKIERQCGFSFDHQTKSGDLIGWVKRSEDGKLPFEIWAFNFNKLSRSDIDWAYYDKDSMYPYPKAFCLFDLYAGDLKDKYYSKFGVFDEKNGAGFIPRTIEPRCGQINQDIVGTIQGMWFGDANKKNGNIEFEGKGLAFIHNNIDPTVAEISVGGNFMSSGVVSFKPQHSGTIEREFSEIKADGKIYCYNNPESGWQSDGGKILVQLLDDHNLKVEHLDGSCGASETFQKPFIYYR